ncbi:COX15/CtaA family protein [Azoarcus olearius]|uniref:Cytochrome aa3 oxidase assembly protein n=1 Tax=Azoarcus sp. (strain BH72) TaxID=418699 RepID=A1KAQ5_AZOSB|nr:COX15/CtaA family protein [Azoarcus olearius]CAL95911.1 putative Cytochrome aa3 oxidase assembly protein [Azoarcus olearius]
MKAYRRLVLAALCLTALVVVFGAYVRLADAGLGCPDWPGCYGRLTPHHAAEDIGAAHAADPHGPVSPAKAWKEMVHRYLAGGLGLLIVAIAVLAWRLRRLPEVAAGAAIGLVGVVVIQALLGKWTVTLLLKPAIVTSHLLGGVTLLGLLSWVSLRAWGAARASRGYGPILRLCARVGLALLAVQIALGGWTSTNYAALACPDFPGCHGSAWPEADYANAFHLRRELGMTADGELLPLAALTAIHWAHRVGAAVAGGFLLLLAGLLLRRDAVAGRVLMAAVLMQLALGVANVLLAVPLPLAAAHNAGAALLVGVMVWINWRAGGEAVSRRSPALQFAPLRRAENGRPS